MNGRTYAYARAHRWPADRPLTDRQLTVLALTAADYSGAEIARRLDVRRESVWEVLRAIRDRFGTTDTPATVAEGWRRGILSRDLIAYVERRTERAA